MYKPLAVVATLAVALLSGAANAAQDAAADPVLATVNGKPLTRQMLIVYTQRRLSGGSAQRGDGGQAPNLMSDLVALEVMAQQAEKEGLADNAAMQAMLELQRKNLLAQALMQSYLTANPVTEDEMRKAYDLVKETVYGTQYRIFQIQVGSESQARNLIDKLNDGADFAQLARDFSQDASSARGGEIGWVGAGQLPAEFASAVKDQAPGQLLDEPVRTDKGWHVVRLAEKRVQPAPDFESSRPTLEQLVRNQKLQAYVGVLSQEAEIEAVIP